MERIQCAHLHATQFLSLQSENVQAVSSLYGRRPVVWFLLVLLISQFIALYRKVMTWARVQVLYGAKVVALVPLVMPLATAHCTAL